MNSKNKKGFTLDELVVVIAIIGILAAILVPTMMSYNKKARLKAANANAKLIFTTAKTKATECLAEGDSIHDITVQGDPDTLTKAAGDDYEKIVCDAVAHVLSQNGGGTGMLALTIDEETYVGYAQWVAGNSTSKGNIIGQYPDPPKTHQQAESITFGTKFTPPSK